MSEASLALGAAPWVNFQPSLPTGLRLRGDDAEAGDDVRLDGDDSVGVIYPRMEQLLIARDLVGIRESVRSARNDDAPARPTLRVETVGFIGDHHAIGGSHGSGDRRGQPGADDLPGHRPPDD